MAKYSSKKFIGLFPGGSSRSTVKKVARMTKIPAEKLVAKPSMMGMGWEIWKK